MATSSPRTIYFAYGSNLQLEQMSIRCPHSHYLGRARLPRYRWQINQRHYANVVALPPPASIEQTTDSTKAAASDTSTIDFVEGLLYSLTASDEARLDVYEEVPIAYEKYPLNMEFFRAAEDLYDRPVEDIVADWKKSERGGDRSATRGGGLGKEVAGKADVVSALVYMSPSFTRDAEPWKEYIERMNKGLDDALRLGVSEEYVQKCVRPWLKGPGK